MQTTLPLQDIIFDGDRRWRDALLSDPALQDALQLLEFDLDDEDESPYTPPETAPSLRREMLRTALRLHPKSAPDAFEALSRVRERLGLQGEIDLFCIPDAQLNAFVGEPEKGRVTIALTSALLTHTTIEELASILGHEIGHVLFQHFALDYEPLADAQILPPIYKARLYAWARYAELSADRIGLLACATFEDSLRASFKLTSHLTEERFVQHAVEVLEQYRALSLEGTPTDPIDWFSTHPYGPLRVKALDLFSRSRTYLELAGQSAEEALSEADLEASVRKIMALMDPTFLEEEAPGHEDIVSFLGAAGVLLARADGELDRFEERMLQEILPQKQVHRMRQQDDGTLWGLAGELGLKLQNHLPESRCARLLEDLLLLAEADGEVSAREERVLDDLAKLLNVPIDLIYALGGDFTLD